MKEISVHELKEMMDEGRDIQLIDVRMPDEWEVAKIPGAVLIPLPSIIQRMNELDPEREAIVYCRSGMRSARAIMALMQYGYHGELSNLAGGILAWSSLIDPSVPQY
ncbi:MAG: rhodanese-like domain-containing protein [Pyrinomonadaceae bacterium]